MNKQEQLRTAIRTILTNMVEDVTQEFRKKPETQERIIEDNTNILLKEVSIRTPLK